MKQFNRKAIATLIFIAASTGAYAAGAPIPSNQLIVDINSSTGLSQTQGSNAAIFGKSSFCFSDKCVIAGNGSTSGVSGDNLSSSVITGTNSFNFGDFGLVLGNNSSNTGLFGIALGDGTTNTKDFNLSVGGRTIGDVLNATSSDQAVNLGQATGLVTTAQSSAIAAAKSYTDTQAASTLTSAKTYTDAAVSQVDANAQGYAATAQSNAIATATGYTDSSSAATLSSANTYTDSKTSQAISISKSYTDSQGAILDSNAKGYAMNAQNTAISISNSYTNQQTTNAINVSKSYTDNQITDRALTYDDASKKTATLTKGGTAVQVKNVAYATQATDAANLQNVIDNGKAVYAQTTQDIQAASASTLKEANRYTDEKFKGIGNKIDAVDSRLNGVGAMAMATGSLHPNPHIPNDNQIALSVGSYRGAAAVAGAIYHYSADRKIQYNATITAGTSGAGVGVAAGISFGF